MGEEQQVESNKAINSLGKFIKKHADRYEAEGAGYADKIIGGGMSGFDFMRRVAEGEGIDKSFNKLFREGGKEAGKLRTGRLGLAAVGTMGILRGTYGAVKGAFTDGQGNIDLPGIPFF